MKKFFVILLCLICTFVLAACGSSSTNQESESSSESSSSSTGKTLVVYYSGTGNTERAANYIAEATGADVFKIEPKEPYSDTDLDYTDDNSRVVQEYNDESKRTVELATTTPENWEDYDTVFIGYPIWWGIAAWPASSFVAANDFNNKTVIPFCTSVSSGLGDSATELAKAAGTGDWQEGEGFDSGVTQEDVETWLEGIGY